MSKATILQFVNKVASAICITFLTGLFFVNFASPVWAQTSYSGKFKLTKSCQATTSISGNNPVSLNSQEIYETIRLNKETNATHAYIKVPDVGNRWIALSCGILSKETAANPPNKPELLPFFDEIDNPVTLESGDRQDITPPPPTLNKFDIAVNQLCGDPGKVVSPASFKEMLNKFPDVLANIKNNVGGYLVAGRTSDAEFLDDLTEIWFNALGFDHVFCGEPDQKKIGGLHYAGRYLDLQKRGLAGRLPGGDNKAEIAPGAVYTLGVVMQVGDRQVKSAIKGYPYTLNAEEILELAAKAYKNNPNLDPTTKVCLLTVTDDGKTFGNVFVSKNGAIRTFYSDATPDYEETPECKG